MHLTAHAPHKRDWFGTFLASDSGQSVTVRCIPSIPPHRVLCCTQVTAGYQEGTSNELMTRTLDNIKDMRRQNTKYMNKNLLYGCL